MGETVDYKINMLQKGFTYNPFYDSISFNMTPQVYEQLTDKELLTFVSDSLTHEHIHSVLYELYGHTACRLFDVVQQYFRETALHEKTINIFNNIKQTNNRITHHGYIEKFGILSYFKKYGITSDDVMNASVICSQRKELI